MEKVIFDGEYFSVKDTLECGQVFRFCVHQKGYLVYSVDKCAYAYNDNDLAVIECQEEDVEYFKNYFDIERDYQKIVLSAQNEDVNILREASTLGKGIRILNQNTEETLFSFIISQNNNIPRIKGIIEKLCTALGEKKVFNGQTYFAFPKAEEMAKMPLDFFCSIGLGYRASYIKKLSESIVSGLDISGYREYKTEQLKKKLIEIYGVGPKVADCVSLFGFHRSDSFPVDTWIEKVYVQDFMGKEKNRNKITEYFTNRFKDKSGYCQQYLFHYKRKLETDKKTTENKK